MGGKREFGCHFREQLGLVLECAYIIFLMQNIMLRWQVSIGRVLPSWKSDPAISKHCAASVCNQQGGMCKFEKSICLLMYLKIAMMVQFGNMCHPCIPKADF